MIDWRPHGVFRRTALTFLIAGASLPVLNLASVSQRRPPQSAHCHAATKAKTLRFRGHSFSFLRDSCDGIDRSRVTEERSRRPWREGLLFGAISLARRQPA